jgi:hypothetical protein
MPLRWLYIIIIIIIVVITIILTNVYMFIFQYIKEIVQFNSNSMALPDEGDVQSLLEFHPQYVHLV